MWTILTRTFLCFDLEIESFNRFSDSVQPRGENLCTKYAQICGPDIADKDLVEMFRYLLDII